MADVQEVKFGMREDEALGVVQFGPIVDGVLHPVGQVRQGDYQEAQTAGKQALEDEQAAAGEAK